MKLNFFVATLALFSGVAFAEPGLSAAITPSDINNAAFSAKAEDQSRATIVKVQVLLDRARFSPGVIDGRSGDNFSAALRAFQIQNNIKGSGDLDEATWVKLTAASPGAVIADYKISVADGKGPFEPIPDRMEDKTKLERLAFTTPKEMLAERFHMDEDLVSDLNPDKALDQPGTVIAVAAVEKPPSKATVTKIEVTKSQNMVRAFDGSGKLVAVFPASIGSEEKPAPTGTLKITRIVRNPVYYYDPKFAFKGVDASTRLKIAPGPNNPVGSVWMNLSEKTYGIHGTAEPAKVGKVGSHGCVRMTNWDASALAAMVKKGTTVVFLD